MPSAHTSLDYHISFATKSREPLISPDWCGRLHEYVGGTVSEELVEFLQKAGVEFDERYLD